jgi:hypothetical protein
MAAVKELATNPAYKDIKLTGAACMGAPFDFAKASRELLADARTPYDRPYIPAYFLATWQDIYPEAVSFKDAVNPALLKTDSTGNAEQWLQGKLGGDQITPLIQNRLTGKKDQAVPARTILNEVWVKAQVDNPGSKLNQLFNANGLVGNWKPTAPVLLVHDPFDSTVDYKSAQAMFDSWTRQGVNPIGIVNLAAGGKGTGHVGGAIVAIPTAFIWIDAGMPRSLMEMSKDKLKDAIAAGITDTNANQPLLPLSRIEFKAPDGTRPYTLSYGDRFMKQGKVKVYTIDKSPVYARQSPSPGTGGYTHLLKELKELSDKVELKPNVPYYISVYPKHFLVALTLKFSGGAAGNDAYTVNVKQAKNKVAGREVPAAISISSNFTTHVQTGSFEHPGDARPFIDLSK